jgi:hypothetical protein
MWYVNCSNCQAGWPMVKANQIHTTNKNNKGERKWQGVKISRSFW